MTKYHGYAALILLGILILCAIYIAIVGWATFFLTLAVGLPVIPALGLFVMAVGDLLENHFER